MTAGPESERDGVTRHYRRTLFDGIAGRYEASRPGYPAHVIQFVAATADLSAGAAVLEIGCGTGQCTERLSGLRIRLTAIDIGPSLIAAARRRTGDAASFEVTSFEDLTATRQTSVTMAQRPSRAGP